MIASAIRQFAFLAIPYVIGHAIDEGVVAGDPAALLRWCAVLAVAVAVEFGGLCGWTWWANTAEVKIAAQLRESMLDVAIGAPAAELENSVEGIGDLVERVIDDVDAVLVWVHGLATWIVILTTVAVLVPAIFGMDPSLLAVTGVCAGLLLLASLVFPRADAPRVARLADAQGHRSQQIAELLATALTVRGFGGQHRMVQRHHRSSAEVTSNRLAVARLRALWNSTGEALPQLGVAAGLAVGAWSALQGGLAVGQIATFAMWMGTVQRATTAATSRLGEYGAARASAARMAAVLALESRTGQESAVTGHREPGAGLALDGLAVERAGWRVGPVDVAIRPGQWAVITGPTGTGKSTLLAAVMGLVDSHGEIRLGDRHLSSATAEQRAEQVTLVPQQPLLLHGTVRDNLLLGTDPEARVAETDLLQACRAAVFDEVLDQLPAGLDTPVGERGAQLSGGQRARLAVARALLRPGPVLLFDDISSALDVDAEARLLQRLRTATPERIVLWASHRSAVLAAADLTLELEGRP